jgi:hypothetical protein
MARESTALSNAPCFLYDVSPKQDVCVYEWLLLTFLRNKLPKHFM